MRTVRGGGTLIAPLHRRIAPATAVARGRARSSRSQPSNERLKLTAPGVFGRIPFVTVHVRRRSLGAIR